MEEIEGNHTHEQPGLATDEATLAALELGVPLERSQTAQRIAATQAQVDSLKSSSPKHHLPVFPARLAYSHSASVGNR